MSKHGKEIGALSPADQRRIEVPEPPAKKGRRKRKEYPPHWEVRSWGRCNSNVPHIRLDPHNRNLKGFGYDTISASMHLDGIVEQLADLAMKFPETSGWPVRFLQGAELECGREVIR